MQNFFYGITATCFVGSYIVAMLLELSRSIWVVPGRAVLTIGFTVAGLFSQAVYLIVRAVGQNANTEAGLLAGWYDWALLVAWGATATILFCAPYLYRLLGARALTAPTVNTPARG